MHTDTLQYEREVTRRRMAEDLDAERELAQAVERTDAVLSRLRAELQAKRTARERHRARVESINLELRRVD